jgi:hypothetical protein
VFGGGRHLFGCCYRRWRYCCVAALKMGMTTTSLSLSSTACAVFLLVHVVSGRQRWQVPTWLLPVHCLYLPFPSSKLLLPPFFPTPHPFLPFSLLWAHIQQVVDPAFGCAQGRWLWWVGCANCHQAVVRWWQCGTCWGGTSDPLIHGIRGCGGGARQGGGGRRT